MLTEGAVVALVVGGLLLLLYMLVRFVVWAARR